MKTPATEHLSRKGIAFSEHTYEYVEHGGTEVPSRALHVPEHHIVKTLVMEDEARKPLVVLMHGDRKVSTKNLARQVGGTSPFGPRKPLPVFAERSIRGLGEIYINGGRRGLLLKIRPADLEAALAVRWVDAALS
jgi:prolyl-tRNA editing enzyme YbaK/EbsC (Cys-tRNA(Pro) deacylase)